MSLSRSKRVLLHGVSVGIMLYGYRSLNGLVINTWIKHQYGGHFQFLTIQGLAISAFTMLMALAADLMPLQGFKSLKRTLFMIAMPVEVVIASIYWPLVIFLPAFILQSNSATSEPTSVPGEPTLFHIPLRVDLSLHAVPAVSLLLDFLLFETSYSNQQATYGAAGLSVLCTVWYSWWVERCASRNGSFPYPFLENPFRVRIGIYAGAAILALASFRALNHLHIKLHSR